MMPDRTKYCIQNKGETASKWVIRRYIIDQLFVFL